MTLFEYDKLVKAEDERMKKRLDFYWSVMLFASRVVEKRVRAATSRRDAKVQKAYREVYNICRK